MWLLPDIGCTPHLAICAVLLEWILAISWSHYYSNTRLSHSSKPMWQEAEGQKDHGQISAGLLPTIRTWVSFLLFLYRRSNPQLLMCPICTGLHSPPMHMSLSLPCCETIILSIHWILSCTRPFAPVSWDLLGGSAWVLDLASDDCYHCWWSSPWRRTSQSRLYKNVLNWADWNLMDSRWRRRGLEQWTVWKREKTGSL